MLQATLPQTAPRINRADSKSGRFYIILDRTTGEAVRYPSVTTILGAAIAKPALVAWSANVERAAAAEAAADLYAELHGTAQLPRSMYLLALEQRLGKTKAHTKQLAKAAEIGSAAHGWVEWSLKSQLGIRVGAEPVLSEPALWATMAWQDFARAVKLAPRFIEQVVYSRTHGFAGTMDLCADLDTTGLLGVLERQGAVDSALGDWLRARATANVLIDLKTGKSIYGEAYLQNCAYDRALAEMGHGRVDGGLIVRLPKLTSDPAFEVRVVPPARELFPTFLAARTLWQWSYEQEQARLARVA
jgi:hypothetical protein